MATKKRLERRTRRPSRIRTSRKASKSGKGKAVPAQPRVGASEKASRAPWIIRTYAGFGDAESSNIRFRENLAKGQRGLSVAFDLPTQNGYDADDEMAAGEVGVTGVAVSHVGDLDLLFRDMDLGAINTSMTINATAPWLFSLYLTLAKKRGVSWKSLRGTTQNDLLKEMVARGTYVFNPEHSLRLSSDLITFASEQAPLWNPINCCGYHYMESGAEAAEEVGYAFANAMMILDRVRVGLSQEAFRTVVERISFFVNSGLELVTEIAKMRAYAFLWQEICAKEYGVKDVKFRAGCQVRSLTLTEQQPEVNIIRIAYEALPAVLSAPYRVGALQLPGFREALSLPDESEQTLALRTQQVLMYETEIDRYGDIFAGSHVIEGETTRIRDVARKIAYSIRSGGYEAAIPTISRCLTRGLAELRQKWESGAKVIVGVNDFWEPVGLVPIVSKSQKVDQGPIERHRKRLRAWRKQRSNAAVERALLNLRKAAEAGENIMPSSIELAEAGGTTGEWTNSLVDVFGPRYQAPLGDDMQEALPLDLPRSEVPYRVLIAKCGLDGHINAVKLLAYALSKAGLEVVFTGIKNSPEQIVRAALQEDVSLIGVSSLAGAHLHLSREILAGLRKHRIGKIPVIFGGIIPEADRKKMLASGVSAVFGPGSGTLHSIVSSIIEAAAAYASKRPEKS